MWLPQYQRRPSRAGKPARAQRKRRNYSITAFTHRVVARIQSIVIRDNNGGVSSLNFIFANQELERLYTDDEGASKYPTETITVLRRRVRHIEAAKDLRDLRMPHSISYDKLGGKYAGKFLLHLVDHYGLILSEEESEPGKRIVIHEISTDCGD
jgi:plasmid maintenance system killer protein